MATIRKTNPQGKGKVKVKISSFQNGLYSKQISELKVCEDLAGNDEFNSFIKMDILTDFLNPSNQIQYFKTEWSPVINLN